MVSFSYPKDYCKLTFHRSPDGQTLMLSSADGYCSIVVFDMAELGTVHPTQQHHRQLAAIAQLHSHTNHYPTSAASTPIGHSPAVSQMRQSPAPTRSEREGSASSSITLSGPALQASAMPPLFVPIGHSHDPSSVASSSDPSLRTPADELEVLGFPRPVSIDSSSTIGLPGLPGPRGSESTGTDTDETTAKRAADHENGDGPKKKRRVALTHLEDDGT